MICVNYFIVFVESFFSYEVQHIKNLSSVTSAAELMGFIRNGKPVVSFSAIAYHYEMRTRFVTRTISRGRSFTAQEAYQGKVITSHVTQSYMFGRWQDRSQRTLANTHSEKITKIRMDLVILFGDSATATDFHERYREFRNEH